MLKKLLVFTTFICFFANIKAQYNAHFLNDSIHFAENKENTWGAGFGLIQYMRNTEYFNSIELGRTLFGYQLTPELYYRAHSHLLFRAGVFLRYDFGNEQNYTSIIPQFTLKYQNNNHQILFGTIESAYSHQLIEPMFDVARIIEHHPENGFQYKFQNEHTFLDTWIDWQKFIERNAPYKERLFAGISINKSIHSNTKHILQLPFQFTIAHQGGQIDKDSIHPLYVKMNAAIGIKWSSNFTHKIFKQWSFEPYYLRYLENSESGMPFQNGSGIYINSALHVAKACIAFSYWNADKFIAPQGSAIYQVQSIDKPNYFTPDYKRELFFIRAIYNQKLSNDLNLQARIEPVLDLKTGIWDYSYSVYLKYAFCGNISR